MIYDNNEQVKESLKLLMDENGVSYKDLADKLGTSQQNVYKMFKKQQLKLDDVEKICSVLNYKFHMEFFPAEQKSDIFEEYRKSLQIQESLYKIIEKYQDRIESYNKTFTDLNHLVEKIDIDKK